MRVCTSATVPAGRWKLAATMLGVFSTLVESDSTVFRLPGTPTRTTARSLRMSGATVLVASPASGVPAPSAPSAPAVHPAAKGFCRRDSAAPGAIRPAAPGMAQAASPAGDFGPDVDR